jgi:hypothetical protein
MKPKIKIVHLLCRPTQPRELASVESVAPLDDFGVKYVQHCNKPAKKFPLDALHCRRPKDLSMRPKTGHLWPGQYGAWKAHMRAFEFEFGDDVDFLIIAECDCILAVPPETFVDELYDTAEYMVNREVEYLSFGGHNVNNNHYSIDPNPEGWSIVSHIFQTHCVMFPKSSRDYVLKNFYESPWDNIDFWYNTIFREHRIAIHNDVLAKQWVGGSLVDGQKHIKLA